MTEIQRRVGLRRPLLFVPWVVTSGKARGGLAGSVTLSPVMGCGVELFVEGNEDHLLLIVRLDNLGKGSAAAALQNMNLLLGCDEFAGIDTDDADGSE